MKPIDRHRGKRHKHKKKENSKYTKTWWKTRKKWKSDNLRARWTQSLFKVLPLIIVSKSKKFTLKNMKKAKRDKENAEQMLKLNLSAKTVEPIVVV